MRCEKIYWALVEGSPIPPGGKYLDWLVHDERHRRMRIAARAQPGAKEARLSYRRLSLWPACRWWKSNFKTGRKHQIRAAIGPSRPSRSWATGNTAARGRFGSGIALHARRLSVAHPVRDERLSFEAPLPRSWAEWVGEREKGFRDLGI